MKDKPFTDEQISYARRQAEAGRRKGLRRGEKLDLEARVGIEPAYTALQAAA